MQLLLLAGVQRCYVLRAGKIKPGAVAITEYIQPALPPVERAFNRLAAHHALTVGAGDITIESVFRRPFGNNVDDACIALCVVFCRWGGDDFYAGDIVRWHRPEHAFQLIAG